MSTTTAPQLTIPTVDDGAELRAELAAARDTIAALSARIEELDPIARANTMEDLLADAAENLRAIRGATGPIELLGSGTRSDVEQLAATALDAIADAQTRLADSPL